MGTDIHGVFQRHDAATGKWLDIDSDYQQERHYQLFAALAGVRNGTGFAGVPTGERVAPIAEPRGLPADFAVGASGDTEDDYASDWHPMTEVSHMGRRARWHRPGDPLGLWMGDHSHSWLSGEEMLLWAERAPEVVQCGILSRSEYEAWDKVNPPSSYCGGISGLDIVQIDEASLASTPVWTHVRVYWKSSLRAELGYFFDEVARLVGLHGRVRFVFGFDS